MLSGCNSLVDDDASGFNKSIVRIFVNGVDASDMLIEFRLPILAFSLLYRAKSTFELTYKRNIPVNNNNSNNKQRDTNHIK